MLRCIGLCVLLALATLPTSVGAQSDAVTRGHRFSVELREFPSTIQRGSQLTGKVIVTKLTDKRQSYTVQNYFDSPYGPAVQRARLSFVLGPAPGYEFPWLVPTQNLEPGEYEVEVGVLSKKDLITVPLRFTVE